MVETQKRIIRPQVRERILNAVGYSHPTFESTPQFFSEQDAIEVYLARRMNSVRANRRVLQNAGNK